MPVTGGSGTSVTVQIPVPTPVQQRPKAPVSFGQVSQSPVTVRSGSLGNKLSDDDDTQAVPPHPPGAMSAVILPWNPTPEGKTRLKRIAVSIKYAAPINAVQPHETAHEALTRFLGNRNERRHGRTSLVHRLPDGDIAVRLHNTNVVIAHQNGQVTMNHGGYMTPTSRRFISGYSGIPVSFAGGRFMIGVRTGDPANPYHWQEYTNNTRFPPTPEPQGATPERGKLTPDQVELLRQHLANPKEMTPLGMLGDSLTESGYPHTGELLSRHATGDPGTGSNYMNEYHAAFQESPILSEHEFHFVPGQGDHDVHDVHIELPLKGTNRYQFRVIGSKPAPTQMRRLPRRVVKM